MTRGRIKMDAGAGAREREAVDHGPAALLHPCSGACRIGVGAEPYELTARCGALRPPAPTTSGPAAVATPYPRPRCVLAPPPCGPSRDAIPCHLCTWLT
jgi:hypothetical protein